MTQLKEILEAYRNKQREFPSYGELWALATAGETAVPKLLTPDLDTLEALARAATPGEWKAMPHGRVVGGPLRHYVNGSAQAQIASFSVTFHEQAPEDEQERQQANADFAAGANPAAVLALIALARRAATQEV